MSSINALLSMLEKTPDDVFAIEKLVYTTEPNKIEKYIHPTKRKFALKQNEKVIVDSYLIMLWKIAYNRNPKFKNVNDRCILLKSWGKKFRDGYPWAGKPGMNNPNTRMMAHGTPKLVRAAEGYADRLEKLEKVRLGRDLGRNDG